MPSRQTSAPRFHLLADFKAALGGEKGISLRSLQQDSENLSEGTEGKETQPPLAALDFVFLFRGKRAGFLYPARALLLLFSGALLCTLLLS